MSEPTLRAAFARTTCACAACVQCCKDQPGPLAPGDLGLIATYMRKPVAEILSLFWASPGAIVRTLDGVTRIIGTITPRLRRGRCVFLDAGDHCAIHAVAPFGCAYADTHMTEAEWQPRAVAFYRLVEGDAEYQSTRRTLVPATSWRPRSGQETGP